MSRQRRLEQERAASSFWSLGVNGGIGLLFASPVVLAWEAITWLKTRIWPALADFTGLPTPTAWAGLDSLIAEAFDIPPSFIVFGAGMAVVWLSLEMWDAAESRLRATLKESAWDASTP